MRNSFTDSFRAKYTVKLYRKSVLAFGGSVYMIISMKSTCLSVCRQGWMGVPLFLLGVVSLAFSQLGQEPQQEAMTRRNCLGPFPMESSV